MSTHHTPTIEGDLERAPSSPEHRAGKAPLTGVLFAVIFAVGFLISSDVPATDASGSEVIAHYEDAGPVLAGIVALGLTAVLLVFFAGVLQSRLRSTGPEWLASVMFGGAVIYAVSHGVFAMTQIALLDAADLEQPDVAQALNIIDNDNFPPAVIGLAVMLLATGWHALTSRSLPPWLGWVSAILGVLALAGPAGIVVFMLFPFWVLAVAITLLRQPAPPNGLHKPAADPAPR